MNASSVVLKTLFAFGDPIAVSTLETILEPTDFDGQLVGLLLEVVNLDETNTLTVKLEPIPDLLHPDPGKTATLSIAAGTSGSIELQPMILRQVFTITAQTASPSYPTVMMQWQLTAYVPTAGISFRY